MKLVIVIGLALLVSVSALGQQNLEKMRYLEKSEKYKRMKRTGTALTFLGGVLFVAGVATLANSTVTTNSYGQSTYSSNFYQGAAAFYLGVAGIGAGIPLWIVGAHSEKKYYKRFETVAIRLNLNPSQSGVVLSCRF